MKNILIGGKLGDFFHSLILPKYIYDTTGEQSNIFICNHQDETFASGLHKSFEELEAIVVAQEYVHGFSIYDYEQPIDIDLTTFRRKDNLFSTSWNEFYLWNYWDENIKIPFNYRWLQVSENQKYNDILLINRNILPYTNKDTEQFYQNYIDGYKDNVYFVCSWMEQYENFPLKHKVPVLYLPSLTDVVTAIASCKHFLGNLTGTMAIASALNKNRTVEIFSDPIRSTYLHELKHYDNLICFQ